MPIVRAQVSMPGESGLPQDQVVNTLHFFLPVAVTDPPLDEISAALTAFYQIIDEELAGQLIDSPASVTYYDLSEPEPRVPIRTPDLIALTVDATDALPPEVALALSFQAPKVSGEDQRRRRGRIYVGPFTETGSSAGRPAAALLTTMESALQGLLDDATAATTWAWVVYSRVGDSVATITEAWIDNEWDTQRRRGRVATDRILITPT